jgi:hypothetical protein
MEVCRSTRTTVNVVVPVVALDAEEDEMLLDADVVVVEAQENDEDNHANAEEEQELGGTRNGNNNSQPYSDASFNMCTVEQLVVLMHGLPLLWLLLDSCSTADIFANAELLTNIHDAPNHTTGIFWQLSISRLV